jgi:hypothetical protein
VEAVKGIVQAAPSALARDLYVEKVAEKLGASQDIIRRALAGKAPSAPAAKAPARETAPQALSMSVVKAELVILAAILREPKLSPVLSKSGAVGDFVHPALRDAADAACSGAETESLLRRIEPDALRQRLIDAMAEMEQAGDQTDAKRLEQLLKKHSQTVALERKQRASPRVPRT